MEKVSIIVPIYNVEDYLEKCIISIINQTYKNIEVILVDDGSPDNCGSICEEWKAKDSRIRVIHKENGGLSDARNSGLDVATGDYIMFTDSDDYIENNMVEELIKYIKDFDADISICNYFVENNLEKLKRFNLQSEYIVVEGNNKYEYLYNGLEGMCVVAWNKLYKKKIFENLRYPVGKINEDEFVIIDILKMSDSIVFINKPLYHYIQRENSIMHNFKLSKFDVIDVFKKRNDFFKKNNIKLLVKNKINLINTMIELLYQYNQSDNCDKKIYNNKLIMIKEEINELLSMKTKINFKIKFKFLIFKYFTKEFYLIKARRK